MGISALKIVRWLAFFLFMVLVFPAMGVSQEGDLIAAVKKS